MLFVECAAAAIGIAIAQERQILVFDEIGCRKRPAAAFSLNGTACTIGLLVRFLVDQVNIIQITAFP